MNPNNCSSIPDIGNSLPLSNLLSGFSGRLFSIFKFDQIIKDTLQNDIVINTVRDKEGSFSGIGNGFNYTVTNSLYSQFLSAYTSTNAMYKKLETIRNHYIVQAALQTLVDDAMAADPTTGEVYSVSVKDSHPMSKKANNLIKETDKLLKPDRVLSSILEDAVFWGEYACTLKGKFGNTKGEGIQVNEEDKNNDMVPGINAIIDANPPGTIFGVYDNMNPRYFIRILKGLRYNVESRLQKIHPSNVWHITIFPQKIRFNLDWSNNVDDSNLISHYFRVGKPLFSSVYNKILELEAFENGQLAKDFADIRRRGMVSVQAPAGQSLDQLRVFTQYYESILNEGSIKDLKDINGLNAISNMMIGLGNVRVIPTQPDRGEMSPIDMKLAPEDTNTKIEDRRRVILESIGIPYEYIFGQKDGNKTDIRRYGRYQRRCKDIQNGVALSLQRLYKADLINKGINVDLEDIDIHFYYSPNINELDKLEFVDANTSLLQNVHNFIDEIAENENTGEYVDKAEEIRYYKKVFSTLDGMENIFVVPDGAKKFALSKSVDTDQVAKPGTEPTIDDPNNEPVQQNPESYLSLAEKFALYEDRYPVLQIVNYLKAYFTERSDRELKYWVNDTANKYPNVPVSILIDIKNEVLKMIGKEGIL